MAEVDFHVVRRETKEAARRAFSLIRSEHPTEAFYAFALYSDSDGTTVCPAANTVEGYHRCLKQYEPSRKESEAILAQAGMTYADNMNYYRWGTSEWAYCYSKADEFNGVYELINDQDPYNEDDPDGFINFKAKVYSVMVLGLKDLDAEGFFGTGKEREAITLLCQITDSLDAVWLGIESARLLNPPTVFACFSPQWMAWQDQENRAIIANPERRSVYRPFQAFLKKASLD